MTKITIAFGSETGTAEGLAEETATTLSAKGYECQVIDLEDFTLDILSNAQVFLLITSTFGEGEPPTNAEDFYDDLMSADGPAFESPVSALDLALRMSYLDETSFRRSAFNNSNTYSHDITSGRQFLFLWGDNNSTGAVSKFQIRAAVAVW